MHDLIEEASCTNCGRPTRERLWRAGQSPIPVCCSCQPDQTIDEGWERVRAFQNAKILIQVRPCE